MKRKSIKYSAEELAWLSKNRTQPIAQYHAAFLQVFPRPDVSAANLHALRKRNGWKTGRTGRFEKGHIPHPDAKPKGPNKTSFKAGSKPHNWKPVGSQRTSKDGYLETKTKEPRTWQQLHVLLWQKHHGSVPTSHCIVFIDGDKANVKIENLELINRNELLQINRLQCNSKPQEIRPTVRAIGKLIAKTNALEMA